MLNKVFCVAGTVLICLSLGGCPPVSSTSNYDSLSNETFNSASTLPDIDASTFTFTAAIDPVGDVDVFEIGTLSAGDRVFVDVQADNTDELDPIMAIFDPHTQIHALNDDREIDASNLNPQLDIIIRGDTGTYYLAVAGFTGSNSSGDYTVQIRITRNVGVPATTGQVVFLDFDGGSFTSQSIGAYSLQPFDAADTGLASSDTEDLKDKIQAVVENRYAAFDFTVLNSDDDAVPATAHSTVYFGGSSASAFALAEQIDAHNADQDDIAIIYTRSFDNAFSINPTVDQMATAIGNTVAHEIGHLLGLIHTADSSTLMDSTGSNNALLGVQTFQTAPIDTATFPIGIQDAVELLTYLLGLN